MIEYLLRTPAGRSLDERISERGADLHTPALCDVEVAALLRRALLQERLTVVRAEDLLDDLFDLPITRHGHRRLVPRVLQLRDNFTAYDGTYVALAEHLDASLVTADGPLARAVRAHLPIPVIEPL